MPLIFLTCLILGELKKIVRPTFLCSKHIPEDVQRQESVLDMPKRVPIKRVTAVELPHHSSAQDMNFEEEENESCNRSVVSSNVVDNRTPTSQESEVSLPSPSIPPIKRRKNRE